MATTDLVKKWVPARAHKTLRKLYVQIIYLLGPNVATWRMRRATRNPLTHREKVRRKISSDRDPNLSILCDKIKVRESVTELIGESYLTKVHYLGYNLEEIDWSSLPREFVCKVNHGAGGVIVVRECADPKIKLPTDVSRVGWTHFEIHPDSAEPEHIVALLKHWLSMDYSWKKDTLIYEWAYRFIKRGVLIEELLTSGTGIPSDYKFYVVNGEVKLIRVLTNRFTNSRGLYEYDIDWNLVGTSLWDNSWERLEGDPIAIPNLRDVSPIVAEQLVTIAEKLGVVTDAVRVDLYAVNAQVIFGELTIYPHAGNDFFTHDWLDIELGKDWRPNY